MKRNAKQVAWSMDKARLHKMNKINKLLLFVAFLMFIPTAIAYASGNDEAAEIGVVMMATPIMGTIGNIETAVGGLAAGDQVKAKLWLLEADQYDDAQAFPARNGREVGTIPLKSGEKWHYIKSVENTPKPNSKGELTDYGGNKITNELPFMLGGLDDNTMNFLEDGLGRSFYVVWEICETGDRFLGGNGCKPMRLIEFEGGSSDAGTGFSLKFQNQCGQVWSKYVGTIEATEESVVAEDATEIPILSNNPIYKLTSGSVAAVEITSFSGVTSADVGRILTIKGSGGTYPSTIPDGNDFILAAGATWTASLGKTLTVRVFQDGAATFKFIEQSRT